MVAQPSHLAYSDESYQTASRYRSVAVVTLKASDHDDVAATLSEVLQRSGVTEFKWLKLRQARDRFAGLKMLDQAVAWTISDRLRIDTLIWDTYDSRHQIPGRNDIANLQRMYYHLFANVLRRRWPSGSTWQLLPDENTALDWSTMQDCLDSAGRNVRTSPSPLDDTFRHRLQREFQVLEVTPACSTSAPLCQLADLFAGLGAFSYSCYDLYETWLSRSAGQMSLGLSIDEPDSKPSNREQERFTLMHSFDQECKTRRLGVGLKSSRGFLTHDPRQPINFWLYTPQHGSDKAPTN